MPDKDFERIVRETGIALQICQAGNIRTALLTLELAVAHNQFNRFLIATDTPTGTEVMPLGMIRSIVEMACLSDHPPEWMITAATGNVARTYGLETGELKRGKEGDLLVIDAPLGGGQKTALAAIKHGDIPGIAACFTAEVPRFIGRSRDTSPPRKAVKLVRNTLLAAF